jgi:hypothetical protein
VHRYALPYHKYCFFLPMGMALCADDYFVN